jgi:hypothetical protein
MGRSLQRLRHPRGAGITRAGVDAPTHTNSDDPRRRRDRQGAACSNDPVFECMHVPRLKFEN